MRLFIVTWSAGDAQEINPYASPVTLSEILSDPVNGGHDPIGTKSTEVGCDVAAEGSEVHRSVVDQDAQTRRQPTG